VLLVDTEAGDVAEVVFPGLRRPGAGGVGRGFWPGVLVGAVVVAGLWASRAG
jgi:hypothetical protein